MYHEHEPQARFWVEARTVCATVEQPTVKELELEIVRCCEREPDRVGLRCCSASTYPSDPGADRCILGQAMFNLTGYAFASYSPRSSGTEAAMNLNNAGVPWGQIPKRAGLVPGEWPVEQPEPEEVTA